MTEKKGAGSEVLDDLTIRSSPKATFTLRELDLRRAARLHVFSSMRNLRTIVRLSILWIGAIVVLVAYLLTVGMPWADLRQNLPLFALIMAAAIFGTAFVIPLVLGPIVIRRRFRQEKLIRQPVSVSWDEEVYEVDQPGVHNRIPWRDYAKWREDRHQFLFFMSDYRYQILPKHVLTQEQIEDIRATLSALSP